MHRPALHSTQPRPTLARPTLARVALVVMALLLAACGGGSSGAAAPDDVSATASTTPPAEGAFPVTVRATNGPVTIPTRPTRIVSLSPTATEMLFALGAGEQVVAVDDQSDHPEGVPTTSLSGFKPNVEAIVAYRPDLVVVADDTSGLSSSLSRLRIPVLVQPAATTLDDSYAQVEQLGAATGEVGGAVEVVAQMRTGVEEVVAATPQRPGTSVYHELDPTFYSATSRTFIGSLYRLLGLRNVADAAPRSAGDYPQLSAEAVVAADPDLVVLADTECCGQSAATVARRPGWSQLTAVRDGHVLAVSDDVASRWGPRVVDFLRTVSRGAAALPGAPSGTATAAPVPAG